MALPESNSGIIPTSEVPSKGDSSPGRLLADCCSAATAMYLPMVYSIVNVPYRGSVLYLSHKTISFRSEFNPDLPSGVCLQSKKRAVT